jgi:hypothetical protein
MIKKKMGLAPLLRGYHAGAGNQKALSCDKA